MDIAKQLRYRGSKFLIWIGLAFGAVLLLNLLVVLLAEGFWFQKVDYGQVFLTRLFSQIGIALLVFVVSLGVLWFNLTIADQRAWPGPIPEIDRPKLPGRMGLLGLLPVVLLSSFTLAISWLYYGQIAISHWQPRFSLESASIPIPLRFNYQVVWGLLQNWQAAWQLGLAAVLMVALLIYPRQLLRPITVLISLGFLIILSEHWDKILLGLNRVPFNETDPLFQQDISFYLFTLPLWELLEFWLLGLTTLTFLSVSLVYLLSADSLSQGYFPGFSTAQLRHLCGIGSVLMLVIGLGYWLDRYTLLYSPHGVAYGAGYTGVQIELPIYTILSLLTVPLAGWLMAEAIGLKLRDRQVRKPAQPVPRPGTWLTTSVTTSVPRSTTVPTPRYFLGCLLLYGVMAILLGLVVPPLVQRLVVQPDELTLETPYIQRTIALTRQGFKLDEIDVETFDPSNNLTSDALERNNLTVENIRLWDKRPLLETNRQLQRIRLYYEFPDADIDRYTLPTEDGRTIQQQVLIAARELDYNAVPTAAQTWVNQHLIYTHGYGFTVSPVNTAGEGGLPDYFIRGIETGAIDPRVQQSIPIGKPRIYYGELTDTYVMTQTQVQELDYPSGSDNVYNTYDGWGGVSIGNFAQRLLYANYLRDWRMMLTDNLTAESRLLFRRNITDRIKTIAPFLRYDNDPYLVVSDVGSKDWQHGYRTLENPTPDESYLYWIVDAYTLSDRYPYSDPLDNDFNYIRNSVKVVIDAYHGSVTFYVADPQDPIIQAWSRVFPGMFQPLDTLPVSLRRHLRYPQDLFQVQSNQLMTYHMIDPIVFYNREDQWRAPNEIYGTEQQLVEPYYLIMKLPIGTNEEFVLLRPFTPIQRNNMIAWLASRSDGDQYGRSLLYVFPKQELVFGPEQIEARINQDPVISERISLWNRQGSRALQGNLLVIPIEQSLLYVEPLYLVAEQTQLPTLVRVIVAYDNRIAIAETLRGALEAIFSGATPTPPIVRTADPPVSETGPETLPAEGG